jgi:hypothetical protein
MGSSLLVDIAGWIGSIGVISAYALISTKRVDGRSLSYQLLNLTGGILLVINTVYYGAYPSTLVNLVWIGIAIYALARILR